MNPWDIAAPTQDPALAARMASYSGGNPYTSGIAQMSGIASQDSAYNTTEQDVGARNIGSLGNQYNAYSALSAAPGASYPTFPNTYGLGSQQAFAPSQPIQGSEASPGFAASPVGNNAGITDSGSRGFNPWSMTGESNAR